MVSYVEETILELQGVKVLILVVVDNGLVQPPKLIKNGDNNVLILVVVDNGLVLSEVVMQDGNHMLS